MATKVKKQRNTGFTVAKYNGYKAASTVLTVGTPIITLACCNELFVHRSDTAISAAGIFAFLLAVLFIKDKLLEFIKTPAAWKISLIGLVFCLVVHSLMDAMVIVFASSLAASTLDEFTFKRLYHDVVRKISTIPEIQNVYKEYEKFGFIWTTTKVINQRVQEVKNEYVELSKRNN